MLFKAFTRFKFRRLAEQMEKDLVGEKIWGPRLETIIPLIDLILDHKSLRSSAEIMANAHKYTIKTPYANIDEMLSGIMEFRNSIDVNESISTNLVSTEVPLTNFFMIGSNVNVDVYTYMKAFYNHLNYIYKKFETSASIDGRYFTRKMTAIFLTLISLIEILIGEM